MKNGKYTGAQLNNPYIKYAWLKDDQYHRESKPAVHYVSGGKKWYLDGRLHRLNGPAISFLNGSKEWYINGKLHREDGPAIVRSDGSKIWYYHGKFINCRSQKEFSIWVRKQKLKAFW